MTESLGFVVLARRPNPWAQDPWDYWAIGKLYRTEAQAITALAKGDLADDIEREATAYRIDQDSRPAHRHHRDCMHNLTPRGTDRHARPSGAVMHGHADHEPCGLSCPVGGADGRVKIHLDNDGCNHRDNNVCPACAELTDEEVAALREYFRLLQEKQISEVETP